VEVRRAHHQPRPFHSPEIRALTLFDVRTRHPTAMDETMPAEQDEIEGYDEVGHLTFNRR
jgi:hypothetical protein